MYYSFYKQVVDQAEKAAMKKLEANIMDQGLRGYAKKLGVSPAYLCDVRYKRRALTEKLLKELLG